MINTLHIENYRSIRQLSLELEQLNIVFGPNGTGKSNIYKAIHLMHSAAQVGFRSPVLASEGANLAAAFQTIVEIGDELLLMRILDQAFPGCVFYSDNSGGRFRMMMQRDGLGRPLEPAEFSDGTLRFLCLAVALLSPRPPAFIALNEPENSLHPQMLPALASLIAEASRYSQIWLTSHSPELATLIEKHRSFSLYQLSMVEGETRMERLG